MPAKKEGCTIIKINQVCAASKDGNGAMGSGVGAAAIRKWVWDVSSSLASPPSNPDNFKPVKKILDSIDPTLLPFLANPLLCLLHVAILSDRID